MFHKVVWQHMQCAMGFLITVLLKMYQRISQQRNFENGSRFDRSITVSMVSTFL